MHRFAPPQRLWILSVTLLTALLLPLAVAAQSSDFTVGHAPSAVVGQPDLATFTAALTAQGLNRPYGIALDNVRGKLYVADTDHNRVLRYDLDAAYDSNPTAEAVFGQSSMTSDTEPTAPSATLLFEPSAVMVDADGNL